MNLASRKALLHVLGLIERDERKFELRREELEDELAQVKGNLENIRKQRAEIDADLKL